MEGTGTKNILIATVLIFLFLVIWQLFIFKPKVQQIPEKRPVEEKAVPTVTTERPLIEGLDSTIFVETPLYIAKISKKGGAIVSFHLKKYKTSEGIPSIWLKKAGHSFIHLICFLSWLVLTPLKLTRLWSSC